jgi:mevalonate kinase
MITVSVPGKIYLMGEHAVVYGKPALLCAINKRLTVTVENKESTEQLSPYVQHICSITQKHLGLDTFPPMNISISSEIPAGYHLGSSAAIAVAVIGAVIYHVKTIWNPTLINKLAFEAEKFMHGNPSGGDNTIVTSGGMIWFRKELPFLTSIWQLPHAMPSNLKHFYLINTGKPEESTKDMVALVKLQMINDKLQMEKMFSQNEEQTRRIAVALKNGDEHTLIDAIKIGERTLEGMGVVNKKIALFIRDIEQSGGSAKILGGGGKKGAVGFLLSYHSDKKILHSVVTRAGYTVEEVVLGEVGARLERHD